MIPRGGSAFLNEVDGNLACIKKGDFTVLFQAGKYRDQSFPEIPFKRYVVFPKRLQGKMFTVLARLASADELVQNKCEVKKDDLQVLGVLADDPTISFSNLALKLIWTTNKNEADKSRVQRAIKRLRGVVAPQRSDMFSRFEREAMNSRGER